MQFSILEPCECFLLRFRRCFVYLSPLGNSMPNLHDYFCILSSYLGPLWCISDWFGHLRPFQRPFLALGLFQGTLGVKFVVFERLWLFWPIWWYVRPNKSEQGVEVVFWYECTKTFAPPRKFRMFGLKTAMFAPSMHFWPHWGNDNIHNLMLMLLVTSTFIDTGCWKYATMLASKLTERLQPRCNHGKSCTLRPNVSLAIFHLQHLWFS